MGSANLNKMDQIRKSVQSAKQQKELDETRMFDLFDAPAEIQYLDTHSSHELAARTYGRGARKGNPLSSPLGKSNSKKSSKSSSSKKSKKSSSKKSRSGYAVPS